MMDFGFGAFLEKFEEHFGKWAVKLLLLLIGLAVALFCGKMIWDLGLHPLIAASLSVNWVKLAGVSWSSASILSGLVVALAMAFSFYSWKFDRDYRSLSKSIYEDALRMNEQVRLLISKMEAIKADLNSKLPLPKDPS